MMDMNIEYRRGDLFSSEGTTSMCHCVSADLKMGKGIATIFRKKFYSDIGMVLLSRQLPKVGGIVVSKQGEHFIYNLVTKELYYEKPKLSTLASSLWEMRKHAIEHDVKRISMPKIGCGLDRLSWNDVEKTIRETFKGTGIEIIIYELDEKKQEEA